MEYSKFKFQQHIIFALLFFILAVLVSSCGYRLIGSRSLPFDSITIRPVINTTYEPKLEERMHTALSIEFINQGIEVTASGSDAVIETTITTFALGAVAAVDETIKEQEIIMYVNLKLTSGGKTTEFNSMSSPIKITFQSTGTVSESVAHKAAAADKACREIAKEIVSKIIIEYAK
ncbi:MAG: LPS assembly lipoprotein LptE [Nitrospirota bacterium]